MLFFEFAQLIFVARKNRIDSGDHSEIHIFTKELLKAGLPDGTDTKFIDKLKPDTVRKYYSGKRKITRLADDILANYKKTIFAGYIKETFTKKQDRVMLCEELKKKSIMVKPNEVPRKLAETFHDILENSKSKVSGKVAPKKSPIKNKDIDEIDDILKAIKKSINRLADISARISISCFKHNNEKQNLEEEFQKEYNNFSDLHIQLHFYFERYPNFPALNELIQRWEKLDSNCFSTRGTIKIPGDDHFDRKNAYLSQLEQLSRELPQLG